MIKNIRECPLCKGIGIYQDMNQTYTETCQCCKGKGYIELKKE